MKLLRLYHFLFQYKHGLCILLGCITSNLFSANDSTLILIKTIKGGLSPKSIVHNGKGLFFAQNMMYQHSITVYNENYQLISRISDQINPAEFGFNQYKGNLKGSPVECAFSSDGKYAYVSNYYMQGEDFSKPGCDSCSGSNYDKSFVYKISTSTFKIENIIQTGSVPKFLAITPDDQYMLISNWSSADVSMIDLNSNQEVSRFKCGRFPRGIAIDHNGTFAYVAVMGGTHIMRINLTEKTIEKFLTVGRGPRHLCIDPNDRFLYASINHDGLIVKINLQDKTQEQIFVGGTPRSMSLSADGNFIYVTNYSSNKITKLITHPLSIKETVSTGNNPIGITVNEKKGEVWVACYSGSLMIYQDKQSSINSGLDLANLAPAFFDFTTNIIRLFPLNNTSEISLVPNPVNEQKKTESKPKIEKSVNEKVNYSGTGSFYIVTGSFRVEDNAKRQVQKLLKEGYQAQIITNSNGFHYAAIGAFENKETAGNEINSKVKASYPSAWVFQKL